ncbi:hypothetical protein ACIOGZ_08020 [Kitasatospora sp. NPDC088160]|uniref:hypothetical protein n=1 Tax=Kitasatospora sp. NPDC088160 TaxID=3364072 RepID=UPI00381AA1EE
MVEKTITVRVCNMCEKTDRAVRSYTIAEGGRNLRVDLCEEDAGPIERLMATGERVGESPTKPARSTARVKKAAPAKKVASGATRRGAKVMTVEEIEALRRQS